MTSNYKKDKKTNLKNTKESLNCVQFCHIAMIQNTINLTGNTQSI